MTAVRICMLNGVDFLTGSSSGMAIACLFRGVLNTKFLESRHNILPCNGQLVCCSKKL